MSDLEADIGRPPTEADLHDPLAAQESAADAAEGASADAAATHHEERIHPEELGDQPSDDAPR